MEKRKSDSPRPRQIAPHPPRPSKKNPKPLHHAPRPARGQTGFKFEIEGDKTGGTDNA